jgi:hypothetical protein
MMIFFLYIIICFSCIYLSIEQQQHPLQAFIHIGPPKTGSTYIQDVLYDNIRKLAYYKFYLPKLIIDKANDKVKTLSYVKFQKDIIRHMDTEKSQNFINNYFEYVKKKQGSVIMSSEAFTGNDIASTNFPLYIENLKTNIPINGTIIMIYREDLSRSISNCNQNVKKDRQENSFTCLNNNIDYGEGGFYINKLDKYTKTFGLSNIKIIDYYGALAENKDIAYILICEIMGILCKELKPLDEKKVKLINSSRGLTLSALFTLFEEYAKLHNCRINTNFKNNRAYNYFNESLNNELIGTKWEGLHNIPLLQFNFSKKLNETIKLDQQLRDSKYGSSIIYGNRQANLDAAQKSIIKYNEIDSETIARDPLLNTIFKSLLSKYRDYVKSHKSYGKCTEK